MNTRYEFNMDVPPREAIRLMYVSKSRFGGDWNSVPHTHSCTEVFYCVDGRGQFNVEGKMLDVAPDDMVIVNPRTLHTELSYQANPLEYIVLGIEGIEILFDQKDHGYTMLKCGPQREELDAAAAAGNRRAGGRLRDGLPGPDRGAACQDRAYGVGFAASHRAARREQGMCHCKTIYR